jgi:hypothetical protein
VHWNSLGYILLSLEATISVRVIDGSWPDGFHGEFAACTVSVEGKGSGFSGITNDNHNEIVLLGFGPGKGLVFLAVCFAWKQVVLEFLSLT